MAAVRVARRISIAWKDAQPFEDTDTLVFTINGYSLDLRVFVGGASAGTIDWATVATVSEIEGSTAERPILRWRHLIDSRAPTILADQGAFHTLPNGDVEEKGIMHNPKTDGYELYAEVWRRAQIPAGQPYFVLKGEVAGQPAYIGRVGNDAMCLAGSVGEFHAWRDELVQGVWRRMYAFDAAALPDLPVAVPEGWTEGKVTVLGDTQWEIITSGLL